MVSYTGLITEISCMPSVCRIMEKEKDKMKLEVTQWHRVEEEGLPEDYTICFFTTESDGEDWMIGSYHEDDACFFVDFGLGGGLVTHADDVYAWADIMDAQLMHA